MATAYHAKAWTVPKRGEDVKKRIGRGKIDEVFLSKDLLFHGLATVEVLREGTTDERRRFADRCCGAALVKRAVAGKER